ncbi:MAG: FGGY-family carbohydrate kinase [Candidatus Thorarchaeota archaeon]|jgi:autoinducer 2 (AI-2) kinase
MPVASIDAGTGGVRCMIVGKNGDVLGLSRRPWSYKTPPFLEIAKEFSPSHFWDLTCTVIREAVKIAGISDSELEAVSTTSQRHGIVLLDSDGNELHGGPNSDARGAMTQYVIEEALGDKFLEITGCWPPLMFAPSRLAWFEEEEPEIHEAVSHLLPVSDWITYRLCGEFVTEPSAASATGFLNIRDRRWSDEILSALGIERTILPEIHSAGDVVGEVSSKAMKDCKLPKGLPVVQGGADTHCALLTCQAKAGEVVVVAGSTTPVMMIVDENVCSVEQRIWSAPHMLPGLWTLESNAMLTGAYIEWVIDFLCERAENPEHCREETFSKLPEILKDIPPGSNETFAALGPRVMDTQRMTDIPFARVHFPQPALPQVIPLNSANLIHAVLENIAYSVRGNHEQLKKYREPTSLKAIGGVTRSGIWLQILANVLGQTVNTPTQPEGTLLGAAICAATGIGWYTSIAEAAKNMVRWQPASEPDERTHEYNSYYSRWKEIWSLGEE